MKQPEDFWSIENMKAHVERPYHPADMITIREVQTDDTHKLIYMVDPEGRGWYETRILVAGRWVSQEEAIFGKRNGKRRSA